MDFRPLSPALGAEVVGELETEEQIAAASYEAGRAYPRYAKRVAIERRA